MKNFGEKYGQGGKKGKGKGGSSGGATSGGRGVRVGGEQSTEIAELLISYPCYFLCLCHSSIEITCDL